MLLQYNNMGESCGFMSANAHTSATARENIQAYRFRSDLCGINLRSLCSGKVDSHHKAQVKQTVKCAQPVHSVQTGQSA